MGAVLTNRILSIKHCWFAVSFNWIFFLCLLFYALKKTIFFIIISHSKRIVYGHLENKTVRPVFAHTKNIAIKHDARPATNI